MYFCTLQFNVMIMSSHYASHSTSSSLTLPLTVTSMSRSSFTKARRHFRRNHFLMHPQKFLILPLVMIFYILFIQKRNATLSPDPFSAKRYFPGWKIDPAVFISADNPQVDDSGPLYMLELGSARTISSQLHTSFSLINVLRYHICAPYSMAGLLELDFVRASLIYCNTYNSPHTCETPCTCCDIPLLSIVYSIPPNSLPSCSLSSLLNKKILAITSSTMVRVCDSSLH